jgi:pimeloyl-ACP methyl ester carboxylesterase
MCARATATTTAASVYMARTVTTSDGVELAVRDYGPAHAAEHTVVLMHGLCLNQETWAPQIRELRGSWGRRLRVITYDHRGHGRSTHGDMDSYRIDRLAADLAEVLVALSVTGPLTLAGHSMGGMTALAYFARRPADRPVEANGLVLVATAAGRLTERGIGRLLGTPATGMLFDLVRHLPRRASVDQAIDGLTRPVRGCVARYAHRGAGKIAAGPEMQTISLSTAAGFLPSLKEYDEYGTLESIAAKTIVISGGTDRTTPVAHSRDLAAGIRGATHVHRPASGHMLLQDEPQAVADAIDSVLGLCHRSVPPAKAA